jgi:anaerobic dimethyl sulfoxide reductase subunit B (iron-sulfur subunit)
MSQLAFVVNSDACAGCKTCQVACNDRHDLPAGGHWRSVYEIVGGNWQKKAGVWLSSVAAYYLSVACHHCENPVCAEGCQADAIWKRPDGLVMIDQSRCTRCRKCELDCAYRAVRWDAAARMVSKCDGCADEVDAGRLPVCVSACPNRALDFGDINEMKKKYKGTDRVFPLPDPAVARPSLVVVPHRNAALVESRNPDIANVEEI